MIIMSLNNEWKKRVERWKNELPTHFYKPLGEIMFDGFITTKQMTVDLALKEKFVPMPEGTKWGAKWEYCWFKGQIALTQEAQGKMIVTKIDTGGESAVYVNGRNAGAVDTFHKEILLSQNTCPEDAYEIMVESYAGHGPRTSHAGPIPPGRETVPEPPATQCVIGKSTFGIWEEEIYQLWLDVETLYQVRNCLDQNSLRVAEIDAALKEFTIIVDFEQPFEKMLESIIGARKALKPLLECINGSTSPLMYVFGHSHIDVAWLWPLAETERKCTRTFASQLALMEQYPEYKFLQSQPYLYKVVKEHYPDLYTSIKEAVKKGQFIPEGGMWVEADTNISGGESLIRQFIHGKRFFKEEFGIDNVLCWLPDVFGYSGALPQIMKGCGIKYFSTQKIFWNYNGGEPFPYNTFIWEGIDGSQVLSHFHNDYNSLTEPAALINRWNTRVQKDGISSRLVPFGYGDGGGGPVRNHLEFLRREVNLEGVPRTKMCSPVEFFVDLEKQGIPENKYVGELYFQAHRGTYTSQAKTKKGNRKSEFALREAELWGVAASVLAGREYPCEKMDSLWKNVLLNQFHDIIPGSSIHRVYQEAEADYERIISDSTKIAHDSANSLIQAGDGLVIFNSLSWERLVTVELPDGFEGAKDINGNKLPVQIVDGKKITEALVPACGWTTIYPDDVSATEANICTVSTIAPAFATSDVSVYLLENDLLKIEFNNKGEIISIYDKETGNNIAAAPCNSFKMYKDVPVLFDAWDIDNSYSQMPVPIDSEAQFETISSGTLTASVKISKKLNNSTMTQEISIKRGSRRIDFATRIDWQESHKLLKVAFPVTIHSNEAIHEIQFGHISRPTHRSRQFDADRFEVCNHKWTSLVEQNRGVAVLNDCKYGINVLDNCINLTLLKSALAPDMYADKGIQQFTYSFYFWNGSFLDCGVIQQGYDLNCTPFTLPGNAGQNSLFEIDSPDIIIETVKPAEDGSGRIVLRMYESMRSTVKCALKTSLPVKKAYIADMLENKISDLDIIDGCITLEFRPFEIKTICLK